MSSQVLVEWLKHHTVRAEIVGHRTRMGEALATSQIAKGRARLVEEKAKPKRRGRGKQEEAGEAEE